MRSMLVEFVREGKKVAAGVSTTTLSESADVILNCDSIIQTTLRLVRAPVFAERTARGGGEQGAQTVATRTYI